MKYTKQIMTASKTRGIGVRPEEVLTHMMNSPYGTLADILPHSPKKQPKENVIEPEPEKEYNTEAKEEQKVVEKPQEEKVEKAEKTEDTKETEETPIVTVRRNKTTGEVWTFKDGKPVGRVR